MEMFDVGCLFGFVSFNTQERCYFMSCYILKIWVRGKKLGSNEKSNQLQSAI